jgi:hypothetical protein
MAKLVTTTALLEGATGLGILALPSAVTSLILGSPLDTAVALALARIAGVAILALGVACWLVPHDQLAPSTKGLVCAMSLYNAGVIAVLVYGAASAGVAGIALWPTVVAHAVMGVWCIRSLRAGHS